MRHLTDSVGNSRNSVWIAVASAVLLAACVGAQQPNGAGSGDSQAAEPTVSAAALEAPADSAVAPEVERRRPAKRERAAQRKSRTAVRQAAESLSPIPEDHWTREHAAHLLRRACFGASPQEIDHVYAMGLKGAVRYVVDSDLPRAFDGPPPLDPLARAPRRGVFRGLDREEQIALRREIRLANRDAIQDLRNWWLRRMVETATPLEEVMTLFWHGHFTTGMREVRNAHFMKLQNQLLREHALGNFIDLANAIGRDPAMLVYLNGDRNVARNPNENYARELLELFTLGEGNYTEQDIQAAARAFTGLGFNDDGFVFRARYHDFKEKTFMGVTGKLDADDIVRIIFDKEERQVSQFLSEKLLKYFVRVDPSPRLVRNFASTLRRNDFDIAPSLRRLFASQAFYHESTRGMLVKSPVQLIVGSARNFDTALHDVAAANRAAASMGQQLFQPPNVAGWDGGLTWINTARLFSRYNVVGGLINGTGGAGRNARFRQVSDSPMQAAPESTAQPALDLVTPLRYRGLTTPPQIIDFLVENFLAVPLAPEKRQLLVEYLNSDGRFDIDHRLANERLRRTLYLLTSTPEYQLH